jgi:Domain of unknown function (DUF4271)
MIATPRVSYNLSEDWMALVFVAAILLIIRVRISSPGKFNMALNAIVNIRLMRQMIREETSMIRHQFMLLSVFCLSSAMLVYLLFKYAGVQVPYLQGPILYLALVFGFGVLYGLKSILIQLVRFMANGDYGLEEYHHNVFLVLRVLGLVFFPISLVLAYSPVDWLPYFLWAALILTGIAFIFRTMRGLLNSLRAGVSLFYIFFYICTFEILPILVFYKVLLT